MSEKFEEFLGRAAADYNEPPEPPREAMWQAIQARRAAGRAGGGGAAAAAERGGVGGPPVNGRRPGGARERAARRWGGQSWTPWAVGLAAMLMIGFGLGRLVSTDSPPASPTASPTTARGVADAGSGETLPALAEAGTPPASGGTGSPAPAGGDAGERAAAPPGAALVAAATPGVAPDRGGPSPDAGEPPAVAEPRPDSEGGQIYRFAAGATLSQAEALLTVYRADAASGRVDPQIARWARDVLSTTRLLLDSPAGADARLAQLLEDLELVLVQVVQLGGEPADGELDMIDETMEQRDMLPRLRTAIPAGPVAVGTD